MVLEPERKDYDSLRELAQGSAATPKEADRLLSRALASAQAHLANEEPTITRERIFEATAERIRSFDVRKAALEEYYDQLRRLTTNIARNSIDAQEIAQQVASEYLSTMSPVRTTPEAVLFDLTRRVAARFYSRAHGYHEVALDPVQHAHGSPDPDIELAANGIFQGAIFLPSRLAESTACPSCSTTAHGTGDCLHDSDGKSRPIAQVAEHVVVHYLALSSGDVEVNELKTAIWCGLSVHAPDWSGQRRRRALHCVGNVLECCTEGRLRLLLGLALICLVDDHLVDLERQGYTGRSARVKSVRDWSSRLQVTHALQLVADD